MLGLIIVLIILGSLMRPWHWGFGGGWHHHPHGPMGGPHGGWGPGPGGPHGPYGHGPGMW